MDQLHAEGEVASAVKGVRLLHLWRDDDVVCGVYPNQAQQMEMDGVYSGWLGDWNGMRTALENFGV